MTKVILIITVLIFTVQSNSQGWVQQNSGVTSTLYSVFFLDVNTGFITGDPDNGNLLLKTTNGGINWVRRQVGPPPTSYPLRSVFFINANTGFICGGPTPLHVVYKTSNGGESWTTIYFNPTNYSMEAIFFVNSLTGIAVGSATGTPSYVFRSTNGGVNWSNQSTFGNRLYNLYFINQETGYACGEPGIVIKTTNSGANWDQLVTGVSSSLRSIYFIDSLTGWIAGTDSKVYKTTNGGNSWALNYNQGLCGLYSVRFADENTGWVCGCEGAINGTTNGGSSWLLQSFASTIYLYSMSFPTSLTGWAVGAGGRILKTTTGGITAFQQISNTIPFEFSLSQNYPNPFNPSTKIRFEISGSSVAQTFLSVYDMLGREISTLVNEELKPGMYEAEWKASSYPTGVYFYRLNAGSFTETKKMVLVK
ncbi:MAG: T9SS type A sorting domain-containing protein [Ignavibacteria bacterium]|nr:T9SS type A sorting domain-containing protein [Ignavibacteria bacterium]